jgi:hypothetical protein
MLGKASLRRPALAFVVLALAVPLVSAHPQGPSSPQQPATGRGLIVGQVVDAAGRPVPEPLVRLTPSLTVAPNLATAPTTTSDAGVVGDSQGRFFFTDVPPGNYRMEASKEGHTVGYFGQRRPGGPSTQLTLGVNERRADIKLTLWKFAVISGTVVDEAGEPVVGVGVRAMYRDVVGGRPAFGNRDMPADQASTAVTDDRGQFRFPRLLPGSYVVFVPSTLTTMPASVLEGTTPSCLFTSGIMELPQRGDARALQLGESVLINMTRVLTPPAAADGRLQVYRPTYFPSAASAAEATPIPVASGDERTGIAIALRPTPAVRVSGRLVTPDGGAPPPMPIRLTGSAAADIVGLDLPSGSGAPIALYDTVNGMSDATGRFTLLGVPPGAYVVKHAQRFLSSAVADGTAYWIAQPLTVGTSDIDDLVVQLKPGLRVEGRVEVPPGVDPSALPPFVGFVVFYTEYGEPGQFALERQMVDGRRVFRTAAAPGGRYVVQPVDTQGWFVESITLNGKDITDRPFDLQSDATSFVVTYTNRPSRLSGIVRNSRGMPSPDPMVVVFPVDESRWTGYGSNPRTVRSTYPTDAGAYAFEHLPPGEYFVVALEAEPLHLWQAPERLKTLSARATRILMVAAASKSVDLVTVRVPQ